MSSPSLCWTFHPFQYVSLISDTAGIHPDNAMINQIKGEIATPNEIPLKMGFFELRIEETTVKVRSTNECHPMMVE